MRLHIVKPQGGVKLVADRTGLDESQMVIEPYGPIAQVFKDGLLPQPGTDTSVTISAQFPEEETFLGAKEKVFKLEAKDTVTMIMLGSQPTVSAMHEYRKRIMRIEPAPR